MALFYETGVASSSVNLRDRLKTFAEAHGWTVSATAFSSPQLAASVIRSPGDVAFLGLGVANDYWSMCGCLGFNAANAYNNQPNHALLNDSATAMVHRMNQGVGPYTAYHLWVGDEDGNDHIHLCIECTAGVFRHWTFHKLVPFGALTGGWVTDSTWHANVTNWTQDPETPAHRSICDSNRNYQFAVDSPGPGEAHFWLDYDAKSNNFVAMDQSGAIDSRRGLGMARNRGLFAEQLYIGYQRYNLRTPLQPLIYFANRGANLRSPIGRVPNMRRVIMRNLFPGETLSIGGVDWKCFPECVRQVDPVANTVASSGLYGYAYRMPA